MQGHLLLILGFVRYGTAILCYECNSATNSMCSATILPESLKRNCSDHDRGITHTLCRKIIQHIDHDINGQMPVNRIIRSCGWDESKYVGSCYHRSGYGGRQEVCSCIKDYCNGSHNTIAHKFVILVATFILICIPTFYGQ